jgi:hypothetical protein
MCSWAIPSPSTPIVNTDYINTFFNLPIISDEKPFPSDSQIASRKEVLKLITILRAEHPDTAAFIDLAFTHNKNFQIVIGPTPKKGSMNPRGVYLPVKHEMLIPATFAQATFKISVIRHEFRHAALHAMHETLGPDIAFVPYPFYPATLKEKKHFAALLETGDKAVIKLKKKLELESQGKLKDKYKKELAELRTKFHKGYLHSFAYLFIASRPAGLRSGQLVDTTNRGKLLVTHVGPEKNGNCNYTLQYQDPLWGAVMQNEDMTLNVKTFPKDEYLDEREAYLHGGIQPAFLQTFYPDLYAYMKNLIKAATNTSVPFQNENTGQRVKYDHKSYKQEPDVYLDYRWFAMPEIFYAAGTEQLINAYYKMTESVYKHEKYNYAKIGFQNVIKFDPSEERKANANFHLQLIASKDSIKLASSPDSLFKNKKSVNKKLGVPETQQRNTKRV